MIAGGVNENGHSEVFVLTNSGEVRNRYKNDAGDWSAYGSLGHPGSGVGITYWVNENKNSEVAVYRSDGSVVKLWKTRDETGKSIGWNKNEDGSLAWSGFGIP